jgi:hypothetical protein
VLLYEMLVGSNPFKGETATDSTWAVIHKDIDLSKLPIGTPSNVHHVLTRCLERNKSKRFRDIGDVRIELEHGSGDSLGAVIPARKSPFAMIVIAAVIFAIAGAGAMWLLKPIPKPTLMNLAIPMGDRFESIDQLALSPDGETIAIIAREHLTDNETSLYAVYVRHWPDLNFRKLQGTDRAKCLQEITFRLAFSPSSEHLLVQIVDEVRLVSEARLVPIAGGPSTKIYEILQKGPLSNIFCYLSEDTIAVFSKDLSKLYRISTSGCSPEMIVRLSGFEDWNVTQVVQSALDSQVPIASLRSTKTDQRALFRIDLETGNMDILLDDASESAIQDLPGDQTRRALPEMVSRWKDFVLPRNRRGQRHALRRHHRDPAGTHHLRAAHQLHRLRRSSRLRTHARRLVFPAAIQRCRSSTRSPRDSQLGTRIICDRFVRRIKTLLGFVNQMSIFFCLGNSEFHLKSVRFRHRLSIKCALVHYNDDS